MLNVGVLDGSNVVRRMSFGLLGSGGGKKEDEGDGLRVGKGFRRSL